MITNTATLCESARVQRDLQFEEQVGQGPCGVQCIRRGSIISVLHQIRRCEAQARRAQPDVLPIVDSQDARPHTGTGWPFPAHIVHATPRSPYLSFLIGQRAL